MSMQIKKSFLLFCVLLGLASQTALASDLWSSVERKFASSFVKFDFNSIKAFMPLLTSPNNYTITDDRIEIAGGLIVITKQYIRSYSRTNTMEFEYRLPDGPENEGPTMEENNLNGIRIDLDYGPTHRYFTDAQKIDGLSYHQLTNELREKLAEKLRESGAFVSFLRPDVKVLDAAKLNEDPNHIVFSFGYNADDHKCMTTFCAGNSLLSELTDAVRGERERARVVEAAVTGKHWNSADLGACITSSCISEMGVDALNPSRSTFEGNALGVPLSALDNRRDLPDDGERVYGLATRNLLHNGIWANAVVMAFPDLAWVRAECAKEGGHEAFIESYTTAIHNGIMLHVNQYRNNYL